MKWLGIALIYCSFCCLVGFAIYHVGNAWPLLGLLIFPSITTSSDDEKNKVLLKALDSSVVVEVDNNWDSHIGITLKARITRDDVEQMIDLLRQAVRVFYEESA